MENQERKGLDILHENSPTSPSTSGTASSSLECRPTYGSNAPLNGVWNGGARGSNVPLNGAWNGSTRGSNVPLNGASNGGARGSNVSLSGALNGGARGNNVPLNGALSGGARGYSVPLNGALSGGACSNNVPLNGALNGGAQGSNVPLNGALDGGARGSIVPLNGALCVGARGSSVSLRDNLSGDARESLFSWENIWSQERQTLEPEFSNLCFTDRNRALPSSSSPAHYHDELPRNGNRNRYLIDLEESEEMFTTNQIFYPQIPNAVVQTCKAERSPYRMQTQNDNVQSLQNHGNELHQLSNSPRTSTFPLIWTSDPSDTIQGSEDSYWKYAAANSHFLNFHLNYFAVNVNNNNNNNQLGSEMNNNLHGYHDQGLCREAEGFGIHHGENAAYPHATATLMSNGFTNVVPRIGCNSRHDLKQYQEHNSLESLWFPPSNPGHDQDFNSAESFQLPPVNCGYSLRPRQVYNSVDVVAGKIYYLAKDHEGCSFLRIILKEGTAKDVQKVLNELANHFVELSSHPSGNTIVRNLLELCSTDQRKFIVSQLTRNPGKLFRISCDMHGVQVVRKVIEVIKDSDEILWVVTALRPHASVLMKDDNGCLVVEHCLERLSPEHSQFLLDVAIACSADLAMDPKGCCTLQSCIKHSTGERKEKLTKAVASLALSLSNDTYGNYAVQCVLDYGTPSSKSLILDLLRGHHVNLSKKKYASNVVEKCLLATERDDNEDIILELLSSPSFSRLAGDQYGNYVVQTALRVSKGPLRAALVNAIKPHAAKLRASPFTKKVLSEVGLKNK